MKKLLFSCLSTESPAASAVVKLLDVVRELKEVVGWMRLGLELGVPKHTLESNSSPVCCGWGGHVCGGNAVDMVEQPCGGAHLGRGGVRCFQDGEQEGSSEDRRESW